MASQRHLKFFPRSRRLMGSSSTCENPPEVASTRCHHALHVARSSLVHSSRRHPCLLSMVCVTYWSLSSLLSPLLFLFMSHGCTSSTTSNFVLVSSIGECTALVPLGASCERIFKAPTAITHLHLYMLCFVLQSGRFILHFLQYLLLAVTNHLLQTPYITAGVTPHTSAKLKRS